MCCHYIRWPISHPLFSGSSQSKVQKSHQLGAFVIMVSQRLFDALPPFPKDVSTADVPKFSLSRLFSGDSVYAHEVFETCRTTGFFLLEMGGEEIGDNMISEVDAMFDISNNVFDLEIEEKTRYAQDASKGKFTGCVTSTLLNPESSLGIERQTAEVLG